MTLNLFFPPEIGNIFSELLVQNTKPIVVRIIYRPPSQSEFLKIININFSRLDTNNNDIFILGDFNIKLYLNNSYIFRKIICFKVTRFLVTSNFRLKQLIEVPARVICSSSIITDHILTSFLNRVSHWCWTVWSPNYILH